MELTEEIDGVFRFDGDHEDPVQVMWRLENEARMHQSGDAP